MPDSNEKEPSIQLRVRPLSKFARRLLKEWKNLGLKTEGPVLVGVSGGADSVALLLGLQELWRHDKLGVDLNVGHFDHGLRIESRGDAAWVKGLAGRLNLSHHSDRASAGDIAQASQENMEQWARHARYDFLERTASRLGAELILTG